MGNNKFCYNKLFNIVIVSAILANFCQSVTSKRWNTEDAVVFEKDPPERPGPSLFDYDDSSDSPKVKRGNKKPERYYEMIDDEVYVFEPSSMGAEPFMEAMQPELHHTPRHQKSQYQSYHPSKQQTVPLNNKPTHFNKMSFTNPQDTRPFRIQNDKSTTTVEDSEVRSIAQGECLTPTDKDGQCIPFRVCYPVVFNMIDGQLRNYGLAKILYKASGPCDKNYTSNKGWDEILRPQVPNADDPALPIDFYNDTVCCPGLNEVTNSIPQESRTLKPSLPDPEYHPHSSILQFETDESEANVGSDYYLDEYDDHQQAFITTEIPRITPKTFENSTTNSSSSETESSSNTASAESNRSEVKVDSDPKVKSSRANHGKKSSNKDKLIKIQEGPVPAIVPAPQKTAWNCPGRQIGMPRGHWPWMVALLNEGNHFCSGSLIDHRHILTSATCISSFQGKDIGKLRVILGDRVLYSSIDGPHIWRKIVRLTRHIQYNPLTMEHDIAMLEMDMSVPYSSNIQPINLPPSEDRSHVTKAIVSGWSGPDIGKQFYAPRSSSDAIVDFMDIKDCQEKYDGFISGSFPEDLICTKPSNTSCMADPGAPLMMKTDNCWHIIGILTNGLGCGTFPEIFTDTARHMAWIQKNIRQHVMIQENFRPV